MPKRNDLEQKVIRYVINTGYQGVLQVELWKKLGASSREGSRVAIKLENKGLIRRSKELWHGRWTYRIFPNRVPASIDSLNKCPCLMCPDTFKCGSSETVKPETCKKLTAWLQNEMMMDS